MDKRPSHISTFSGGMDRDTNFANLPKEKYYELKNGRVVVNNYSNSFSVTPFKQPEIVHTITPLGGSTSADVIIGSILIRDGEDFQLVLFTTQNHGSTGTNLDNDRIWLATSIHGTVSTVNKYNGKLGFNIEHLIEGVSKFESSNNIKIYWWDNLNPFRYCNIKSTIAGFSPEQFENIPDTLMEQPKFIGLSNGSFKAGKVQYCYKLYNNGGSISNLSPFSGMINLTKYNEDGYNFLGAPNMSYGYIGTQDQTTLTENTGKAVTMFFDNLDSDFHKIKVYSIFYSKANIAPVIKLIADTNFNGASFTITDTDNLTGSTVITADELLFENYVPYPKTGVTKFNTLYLGNINKNNTIIPLDFRAYRSPKLTPSVTITSNGAPITYDVTSGYTAIPTTSDAIQTKASQYATTYAYQKNSEILGGEGTYIKYSFYIYQDKLNEVNPVSGSIAAQVVGMPQVFSSATSVGLSDINSEQNTSNYPLNHSFSDYNSPYISYMNGGYCRDEVYAFAIVFRNNKGQKSFPIWIADIKMPAAYELDKDHTYGTSHDYNITYYDSGTDILYYNALGIKFTLKAAAITALAPYDVQSWEIVRMPRKIEDKSIVAQGLLAGGVTVDIGGQNRLFFGYKDGTAANPCYHNALSAESTYYKFATPEYYFDANKENIVWADNDNIEIVYMNRNMALQYHDSGSSIYFTDRELYYDYQLEGSVNSKEIQLIGDIRGKEFPSFNSVQMGFYFTSDGDNGNYRNYRGSFLALKTVSSLGEYTTPVIANYTRDVSSTAYGGNTYSSRFNRNYISTTNCVNILGVVDQSAVVFGGDTYITMFDHLYMQPGYKFISGSSTFGETYLPEVRLGTSHFAIESTYNTNLRYGSFISKIEGTTLPIYDAEFISSYTQDLATYQEKAGTYSFGGTYNTVLTKDYYIYNTVYSQYPLLPNYIPLPEDFDTNTKYDARIIWSETKITGESLDSWLIFPSENKKDLDYEHGPINRLHKFKDNVFSFQTKAFSLLSINPRTALSVQDGLPIQIGSGSKLERYDYVSTKNGCYHRFGVTDSENGLYFIDGYNKKLMMYSGQNIPLSDLKGMYSYLNKETYQDVLVLDLGLKGMVSLHYDVINNDVIFSFNNSVTYSYSSKHITFNEILKSFTSINDLYKYDATPPTTDVIATKTIFIPTDRELFVSYANNELYQYDKKLSLVPITELSVVVNSEYTERKVFDNLYFDIDIYDITKNKNGNYVHTKYSIPYEQKKAAPFTINSSSHTSPTSIVGVIPSIQYYNDWQNTGEESLVIKTGWQTPSNYNLSRVEREYEFKIPGNDVIDPAGDILDIQNLWKKKTNWTAPTTDWNKLTPMFRDRMRGKYVICKIKLKAFTEDYPASSTLKTFALNYLKTLFRPSY